jgi:hypothetical protein
MLSTLRLKWPLGQTILLAFLLMLPLAGLAEVIFRSEFVRELLSVPEADHPAEQTVQPQDQLKWERLEQLVEEQGEIDCLFLGSSRLSYNIKPDVFEEAYQAQTGQPIHCFNYGGLLGSGSIVQEANLIVDRYQPDFLIISIESFALDDQIQNRTRATRETNQSIEPGPIGQWLNQHSLAYRYYTTLSSRPQPASSPASGQSWSAQVMSPDGYIPYKISSDSPIEPPTQRLIDDYRRFTPYRILPDNLVKVMELQAQVPILLLELPVHPTLMYFFENGVDTYREMWIEPVETIAARRGTPFWQTSSLEIIPEEGWGDRSRLNPVGAEIFSRWLGGQVGQAAAGGSLQISPGSDRTEQP